MNIVNKLKISSFNLAHSHDNLTLTDICSEWGWSWTKCCPPHPPHFRSLLWGLCSHMLEHYHTSGPAPSVQLFQQGQLLLNPLHLVGRPGRISVASFIIFWVCTWPSLASISHFKFLKRNILGIFSFSFTPTYVIKKCIEKKRSY